MEQLQIVKDEKKRKLFVGNWCSNEVIYNRSELKSEKVFWLKKQILAKNNIVLKTESHFLDENTGVETSNLKAHHEEINSYLGASFNKRFIAINMEFYIDPIRPILNKYCFYSSGFKHWFDNQQILRVWKHKALIDVVIQDQLDPIVPLVIYFGLSPADLKKGLGKGLWKNLCNNSLAKNKTIVQLLGLLFNKKRTGRVSNIEPYIYYLSVFATLKSTLLKLFTGTLFDQDNIYLLPWLNKYAVPAKFHNVYGCIDMINDTKNMAKKLGLKFSLRSFNKLNNLHNKYSKELLFKSYSNEVFQSLIGYETSFKINNVSVEILNTPFLVALEAKTMHHCVHSYIDDVAEGSYLVLSLSSVNSKSTLGLNIPLGDNKRITIDQHYGAWNEEVKCPDLISFAKNIHKNNLFIKQLSKAG